LVYPGRGPFLTTVVSVQSAKEELRFRSSPGAEGGSSAGQTLAVGAVAVAVIVGFTSLRF
jgi:hypothetical protein